MKVSVCMITYNHEEYIKDAIEGVLMQDCNFDLELVIADDCSIDNTFKIVHDIIQTHPKGANVRYTRHKENKGMMPNFIWALENCTGEYTALCEGDDYWTDNLKLQKQVDFLENNKDYNICFHNVEQVNLLHKKTTKVFPGVSADTDYDIYDYIQAHKTATCSIVYRTKLFVVIPKWYKSVPFGDLGLVLTVLKNSTHKKGRVLKDNMAVYRMHGSGVNGSLHKNNKGLILAYKQILQFDKIIEEVLFDDPIYKRAFKKKKVKTYTKLYKLAKEENNLFQYGRYKLMYYIQLMYLKTKFRL